MSVESFGAVPAEAKDWQAPQGEQAAPPSLEELGSKVVEGAREKASELRENIQSRFEGLKERGNGVKEKAGGLLGRLKEHAQKFALKTVGALTPQGREMIKDNAKEAARNLAERGLDASERLNDAVERKAIAVKDRVQGGIEAATTAAQEKINSAREAVQTKVDTAKGRTREWVDHVKIAVGDKRLQDDLNRRLEAITREEEATADMEARLNNRRANLEAMRTSLNELTGSSSAA